jgi:hypothetical protein
MVNKRLLIKMQKYHLAVFLAVAAFGAFEILQFKTTPAIQFFIITFLAIVYLAWASIYHLLDKSLNLEVMLEYILTALLVLVVFYGFLI